MKLIALLMSAMIALPIVASAQNARVQGLGIQGDYIKDWTGILGYPGGVSAQGNLIWGEMGSLIAPNTLDRAVGAVLGNLFDGRGGTWAIFLREEATPLGSNSSEAHAATGNEGSDPNVNTNSSFDLEWGKQFGTMRLGARLRRASMSDEITVGGVSNTLEYDISQGGTGTPPDATGNPNRNIFGFGAGLQWEFSAASTLDAAFTYESRTFKSEVTGVGTVEEDSPTAYLLNARLFWQWQPDVMLVPVFKWYSYEMGISPVTGPAVEASLSGWQIGAAGNWALSSNDLFVLGLTFASNKVDQDTGGPFGVNTSLPFGGVAPNEITETLMPQLFAALETHVNPWLTLRFGATNSVSQSVKVEDNDGAGSGDSEEVSFSDFDMSLGAGLKIGNLQLDGVMNPNFPFTLGYVTSGVLNDPVFLRVSATYPF
jgi:hypothetical protein